MASNIRINNRVVSTLQVGDVIAQSAYYGQSFVFITAFDPDAATYIEAVEAADEQTLEAGVKLAIDGFVTGCKADGIWDAIKASCILAGARTLNGALVPLAGDAPTNFNFVSADYDRVTGLKGDGSTKYLDSNRNNNADPQNSQHLALFRTEPSSTSGGDIGCGLSDAGASHIATRSSDILTRNRSGNFASRGDSSTSVTLGLLAMNRSSSTSYTLRIGAEVFNISRSSRAPMNANILVFGRNGEAQSDMRAAFYSIGEAIDLAALDARVSTLMTEIEAELT